MENKLIVAVRPLRQEGWVLPRFRLAMGPPFRGVLTLKEETVMSLNRSVRIATLIDPTTSKPISGLNPLLDAVLLHMTPFGWVLTGFERFNSLDREIDSVQSWCVIPISLQTASE